jgi:membrane associated rhomboid family serine protease
MGIYDREYYRREGPSFLGALTEQGKAVNWLLGLNIVCFIIQMMTRQRIPGPYGEGVWFPGPFTDWLDLVPSKVLHGEVWRLLSYAFLHDTGSFWHILFNMLFLFWFGRQVEGVIGSREFILFYLISAVLGGLAFLLCSLAGLHNMGTHVVGASGAVTAVLVLAACYNPRQVIYLFFLLPVPIWAFVVLSVALDAFGLLGRTNSGVATSVHLGGAAFGFAYWKWGWRLAGLLPRLGRSRPRLRLYREDDVGFVPAGSKQTPQPAGLRLDDEHLEAQVDAILAKIPSVGMEGLTEQERQVLVRASEAIKRRRG